ncbi:lysozyme inhibitor LprI family protein [Serratia sp. CY76391]|uniref:lysozyme inhibitor LprI family protein n=1 Tax=Serratia sp. CY76391 TaxID=3383681 RepID=UPI003F9F9150
MKITGTSILSLIVLGISYQAGAASFDCAKAKSFAEKTICNDAKLSKDDDDLKYTYGKAKASAQDRKAFSEITKTLWNSRERCQDYACVNSWYDTAFGIYSSIVKTGIPATNGKNEFIGREGRRDKKPPEASIETNAGNSSNKGSKDFSLYDSNERAAPVEHDAVLFSNTPEAFSFIDKLVLFTRSSSYKCDSVSAFRPLMMSNGYSLICNKYSYKYEIKDNGGNVSVSVDN